MVHAADALYLHGGDRSEFNLGLRPRAETRLEPRQHFLVGTEVSGDGQDGVVRPVVIGVVGFHVFHGDGVDGGQFAAPAVRMARSVEGAYGFAHGLAAGVVVAAADHLQRLVPLELHLFGLEGGVHQHVGVNIQHRVQVLLQRGHIGARFLDAHGGFHRGGQELQRFIDVFRLVLQRAAVLQQAGGQFAQAYLVGGVVELAGPRESRQVHDGQRGVLHQVDHQAVLQDEAVAFRRLEIHRGELGQGGRQREQREGA